MDDAQFPVAKESTITNKGLFLQGTFTGGGGGQK